MKNFISPLHLYTLIHSGSSGRLIILDASYGADAIISFEQSHLPDAIFFDIDDIADPLAILPHTAPTPAQFANKMQALGITETDNIIIYDQTGFIMAASRAWWLFKLFGHKGSVQILDGGLRAWLREGYVITNQPTPILPNTAEYKTGKPQLGLTCLPELMTIIETQSAQIADARPYGRFSGNSPEPRPGMLAGHMPGAVCTPALNLTVPETGYLKPLPELNEMFTKAGLNITRPIITTCGSGVTACAVAAVLDELGCPDICIYDGSWAEYGDEKRNTKVVQDE